MRSGEQTRLTRIKHETMVAKRSPWSVIVHNPTDVTLEKGMSVIVAYGNTSSEILCVEAIASSTVSRSVRALGVVIDSPITPNTTGTVRGCGTVTDMWVTGAVSEGNWLRLSQTYAGLAVADNTTPITRLRYAIAGQDGSTTTRNQIRAYLPNMRV